MNDNDINPSGVAHPLKEMNPWWGGNPVRFPPPKHRRHIWRRLDKWLESTTRKLAINIVGPRYVGKTTVLAQMVEQLLGSGVKGTDILFAKFDDPRLERTNFREVVDYWIGQISGEAGVKYLLFDEIQYSRHWGYEIKNMVDSDPNKRIFFTGSSLTMSAERQETGVGRWIDEHMGTMSFGEYLEITKSEPPKLPAVDELTNMDQRLALNVSFIAEEIQHKFNRYLMQGGYPHTALESDRYVAQTKIIDQVGKLTSRELPTLYRIENYWVLPKLHKYLAFNDGGILNYSAVSSALGVSSMITKKMVKALDSGKLIKMLHGISLGQQALKGREKIYVTDQSLVASMNNYGVEDIDLGAGGGLVESAVFHHLFQNTARDPASLGYWRDKHHNEVDFVVHLPSDEYVPIEVKFRTRTRGRAATNGLEKLHKAKKYKRCYMLTKQPTDVGTDKLVPDDPASPSITRLPAAVFCLLQSNPMVGWEDRSWL